MQVEKLKTIDADTLLSTPMRKTLFVVDGLIPQGLSVLSRCTLSLLGGYLRTNTKPPVSNHRRSTARTSNCHNEFSNRQRFGTANRTVSFRLSENKACHYRHLSKGSRFKKHRRKKRNVCRRLRRCIGAEKYFG